MSKDLRHRLGRAGERFACSHFERLGYEIIARNHRTRYGELDIIAGDRRTLVFCEVKTHRQGSIDPWEKFTENKRRQVRKLARSWLMSSPKWLEDRARFPFSEIRFDAIAVKVDTRGQISELNHLEGVF